MSAPSFSQQSNGILRFAVTHSTPTAIGPRLGSICVVPRKTIQTPHYVATTSRGSVPHVSPDLMRKHTRVASVYIALEDFIEKTRNQTPPILTFHRFKNQANLRDFVGLHDDVLVILGPRRVPSVPSPGQNTNTSIAVLTATGFQQLDLEEYNDAIHKLCPDIAIAQADIIDSNKPSRKRIEKSVDRTHAWLRDTLAERDQESEGRSRPITTLFASIPPVDEHVQTFYLDDLAEEFRPHVSGLATSAPATASVIPPKCDLLPRLCFSNPRTPHEILEAISFGVDLITTPLVTSYSDAGRAFIFAFPCPASGPDPSTARLPLTIDLWSSTHSTSLSPISLSCHCHTCARHHRAYISHLLSAKEMLAWTLLQLHNHASMDAFFEAIRVSISAGTFERDMKKFAQTYEAELPVSTGSGPRVRGYQAKSTGGGEQPRLNPKAYGRFDEKMDVIRETNEAVWKEGTGTRVDDVEGLMEKMEESGLVEKA